MIVDYSGASPAASIRAAILSAKGTGNWAGPGLTSNLLAFTANAAKNGFGYAEAWTCCRRRDVRRAVGGRHGDLVRYTIQADANLDGQVNFTDLLLLGGTTMRAGRG